MSKNWTKTVAVGDEVSYSDVNLWSRRGTLVSIGNGQWGGDCVVLWHHNAQKSEECLSNLIAWKEEPEPAEEEPITVPYRCLACGMGWEIDAWDADGGKMEEDTDALPPGDEHCSHQWEKVVLEEGFREKGL